MVKQSNSQPNTKPDYCEAVLIDFLIQMSQGVSASNLKVRFSEKEFRK